MRSIAVAQFWFQSFRNTQSDLLSVLAVVMLPIELRQQDSPQSKPVESPHNQIGVRSRPPVVCPSRLR